MITSSAPDCRYDFSNPASLTRVASRLDDVADLRTINGIADPARLAENSILVSRGKGPDDMIPDEISFDFANPKYRQFKSGENTLEYTLEGGEITVDWMSGNDAALMIKTIMDADGAGVTRISGYVTDKLGGASDAALRRLGNQMTGQLGSGWKATIQMIEGRRYLVFTK